MGEPERLGEILSDVMVDICNRQKKVLSAISGYYQNRRQSRPRGRRRAKQMKLELTYGQIKK